MPSQRINGRRGNAASGNLYSASARGLATRVLTCIERGDCGTAHQVLLVAKLAADKAVDQGQARREADAAADRFRAQCVIPHGAGAARARRRRKHAQIA